MSSSSEDNSNLVKCAEEICEVFADSVSSLVLMLVALQEKNRPPQPELREAITHVIKEAENFGNIARELAESDYEEYPEIQSEILDACEQVTNGCESLSESSSSLTSSNLQEGYNKLVDGCSVVGTTSVKLLQVIYGASFKKIAQQQENMRKLAEKMDTRMVDEDPQSFADIVGEFVSAALQLSEDLKTQAESESVPSDKAEMEEIAENIAKYAEELLDAANAYLEDPENEELRIAYEEAKKKLLDEMERAKERVAKSHEVLKQQQKHLDDQSAQQKEDIKKKMAEVKPLVPKEEQIERGKSILERLDKSAEAVFWNNPKDFVLNANPNMQEVPKFVDGRIADAKNEGNKEKEQEALKIKEDYVEFVDKAKAAFTDYENEEKKKEAIKIYKTERERIIKELDRLGVDEEELPPMPQVEEATFDFDEEDDMTKTEEALQKVSKERLEMLKDTYKRIEAMEHAVDNAQANAFIENAKPVIGDVQKHIGVLREEAVKEKDAKKKKVAEKLANDLSPSIQNGQAAAKGDKEKVPKAKESLKDLKEDIIDALVAEGVNKKGAEKILDETKRDEETIKELLELKQSAVEIKNAVEKKSPQAIAKELREAIPLVKEKVPKIKEKGDKLKEPMLKVYADEIITKFTPMVQSANALNKDIDNEEKQEETKKAIEEYIEALDASLKRVKATEDEMTVVPKNKIDSEIAKKAEKTKEKVLKVADSLFDEDIKELHDAMAELEEAEEDMMKEMKEEAKKSGNKSEQKRVEEFEKEFKEVQEAIDDVKKAPKEKVREKRQKAQEKLRDYNDKLIQLQEEEGRPIKQREKAKIKVDKDLQKLREAVEVADTEKVKESSNKLMEDFGEYKKLVEADGDKLDEALVASVKDAHSSAITSAREVKNVIKRKEAVEKIKKCRDKLYGKAEKPKTEEKLNQEALKEIEEIEMHADTIVLNEEEELHVLLEEIRNLSSLLADALLEEDEEKVKAAKEALEKAMKRKEEIFEKALERLPEKDREIMRKANEKLKELNKRMVELADQALEDGDMKGKAEEARKISGETAQVIQPMKAIVSKSSEIRADDAAQAILEDCKLAEKIAKNPNEKLCKECKEKLQRDMERYEKAIKEMLENADLTPEEKEKLLKQLEEAKKKQKEIEKYLDRLIKNPKDEEARKKLEEEAKELSKIIEDLQEDFNVKDKAQCEKAKKAIEKCKESAITKSKEEGEKALAELEQEEEELLKTIDERIAKEKDEKKKKELEKEKELIKLALDECKEKTKKALESGSDDDILDCDISCELASSAVDKYKEKLRGGKSKGSKKVSAAERMRILASARKAMKGKNFTVARDELMKLKEMLKGMLDDPDLDEETRQMIEELLEKIDMALADIENAEASGLMSEIAALNSQLSTMLSNEISEQAKAKTRAKGIAARARAGKKSNLKSLVKGARDLANKMKNLKFNVREEARDGFDQLSDEAKAALQLNDLLDDISAGVDLDGMLDAMHVDEVEEEAEAFEVPPVNRLEAEIAAVATIIKQVQIDDSPSVCGDIAIHFRELAKHAANANKEGIIVEGRTIAAAIAQFCKELAKAQPVCKDRRVSDDMARALQALRNLSTQLKIVCSVKAATVGKGDVDGDNQLISICQNIGSSMKQGMESLNVANKTNLIKK